MLPKPIALIDTPLNENLKNEELTKLKNRKRLNEEAEKAAREAIPRTYYLDHSNKSEKPGDPNVDLRFFVFGCQGNKSKAQKEVARLLEEIARDPSHKPDFILILGDNFYDWGVGSADDKAFRTHFDEIYGELAKLGIPCFVTLGNHDANLHSLNTFVSEKGISRSLHQVAHSYRGDDDYETTADKVQLYANEKLILEKLPLWNMPARAYSLVKGNTQIFCIDSNTYVNDYLEYLEKGEATPPHNQARWLAEEVKKAKAEGRQMILALHHPLFTTGSRAEHSDIKNYFATKEEKDKLFRHFPHLNEKYSYNYFLKECFAEQEMEFDQVVAAHDHNMSYYNNNDNDEEDVLKGNSNIYKATEDVATQNHPIEEGVNKPIIFPDEEPEVEEEEEVLIKSKKKSKVMEHAVLQSDSIEEIKIPILIPDEPKTISESDRKSFLSGESLPAEQNDVPIQEIEMVDLKPPTPTQPKAKTRERIYQNPFISAEDQLQKGDKLHPSVKVEEIEMVDLKKPKRARKRRRKAKAKSEQNPFIFAQDSEQNTHSRPETEEIEMVDLNKTISPTSKQPNTSRKKYHLCQVTSGGGGGSLQTRINFRNQKNLGCFLEYNGFTEMVCTKNNIRSIIRTTNHKYHLEFDKKSNKPFCRFRKNTSIAEQKDIEKFCATVYEALEQYFEFLNMEQKDKKGKFFSRNFSHGKKGSRRAHNIWAYISNYYTDDYQTMVKTVYEMATENWKTTLFTNPTKNSLITHLNDVIGEVYNKNLYRIYHESRHYKPESTHTATQQDIPFVSDSPCRSAHL